MFPLALLLLTPVMTMAVQPPATAMPALQRAAGTFEVKVTPNSAVNDPIGVLALTKTYHGELAAIGTGQMIGSGAPSSGTASYVALERVSGTLAGHQGSFVLQHIGWMNAGRQELTVTIAPGSGTGGLAGIAGRLEIIIAADGGHSYVLHYTLPR